jgi:lipopolysaccharide transport system permease protein
MTSRLADPPMINALALNAAGTSPRGDVAAGPLIVIGPGSGWRAVDLRELWRYRELLWILAERDIKVRYKQTLLGVAWAVLQPVLTMVVFTIFFGQLAGVERHIDDGLPYAVYTLCALLPWQLFANSVTNAGNSLINNQNLITKVYFPRLVIPLAAVGSGLVDLAIALVVLLAMMLWHGIVPTATIVLLPLFVLLALAASTAVGLWLAALNVEYRDIRYVIPFLVQIWMFVSPVAYPASLVRDKSERLYHLYGLNPMTGVIEGFRWCLLGSTQPPGWMLMTSTIALVSLLLVGGAFYFRRMERSFADLV